LPLAFLKPPPRLLLITTCGTPTSRLASSISRSVDSVAWTHLDTQNHELSSAPLDARKPAGGEAWPEEGQVAECSLICPLCNRSYMILFFPQSAQNCQQPQVSRIWNCQGCALNGTVPTLGRSSLSKHS
jgi:hypothetical protein